MSTCYGTSSIIQQYSAHRRAEEEYDRHTANCLTSRSFQRHGVDASTDNVEQWARLNGAIAQGNVDIPGEQRHGESMAEEVVSATMQRVSGPVLTPPEEDESDNEVYAEDDDGEDEEEYDLLADIFGYDNDDDNAEAALDTVLRYSERPD
ncbi:hypothetical protein [Vreelandella gomseomensis]|uniref:Uncharacterized protein n=1 Tax=Vreelandella gomseomensis TaxID=370766 RepID=A0ABU1GCB4_9GAMM|nr:hypothetical protein [Halomonas gomseomensis]MDR5875120.1 hypothetical protein [Halomonas gomseomensis]